MKTCYYEVLGLEKAATELEIKKAYRREALRWHPDKNPDDLDAATEKFKEVQNAYAVLSDPQERSWYDGHKSTILGDSDDEKGGEEGAGISLGRRGPPGEKSTGFFTASCFSGFNDASPQGFYQVYAGVFGELDAEEEACEDAAAYHTCAPAFGNSEDDHDAVGRFYAHWEGFVTRKEFLWADRYDPRDARDADRYVRRRMEQENKKARAKKRKEFIDTVRNLAEFVKKRDPRVKAREWMLAQEKAKKLEAGAAKVAAQRRAREEARLERAAVAEAKEAELAAERVAERLRKEEAAAAAKRDIKRQRDRMRNAKRRLRKLCESNAAMQACENDELRDDGPEVCGNGLELDVLNALIASIEEAPADAVCSSFGNLQSCGGDARAGGAERE